MLVNGLPMCMFFCTQCSTRLEWRITYSGGEQKMNCWYFELQLLHCGCMTLLTSDVMAYAQKGFMHESKWIHITVTIDYHNLISSFITQSDNLCQIWRNALQGVTKTSNVLQELDEHEVTVTFMESKWTVVANLKKFQLFTYHIYISHQQQLDEHYVSVSLTFGH